MLKAIRDAAFLIASVAAVFAAVGCVNDTGPPPRPADGGRVDVKAGPVDVHVDKDVPSKKVDVKVEGGRVDVNVKPDRNP